MPGDPRRDHQAPRQHLRRSAARFVCVAGEVIGQDGLAAVSSFGTEAAALLKLISEVVQLRGCWRTKRRTMSEALTCTPRSLGTSVSP
jgi:hypothetical protein